MSYEEMSTDGLTEARERVQRRLDELLEVFGSPKSPVRDAKEAGKRIGRVYSELAQIDAQLNERGIETPVVPTEDALRNQARWGTQP